MPRPIGKISVVAVGKIRTRSWLAAQKEYVKRLGHYTNLELVEVKDVVGRGLPDEAAMQREGEQLLKAGRKAAHIVPLSPEGEQLDSPELADFLQGRIERYGRIAFLIGGPLGFSPEVIAAAHSQLALSRLTFTHELARVILLEQLYRGFTILNNEKYHK